MTSYHENCLHAMGLDLQDNIYLRWQYKNTFHILEPLIGKLIFMLEPTKQEWLVLQDYYSHGVDGDFSSHALKFIEQNLTKTFNEQNS